MFGSHGPTNSGSVVDVHARNGPANTDIISGAADLAASLNGPEASIALYGYTIARDPLHTAAHVSLGIAYLGTGRLGESIGSLRTVLRLAPEYVAAHYLVGMALL